MTCCSDMPMQIKDSLNFYWNNLFLPEYMNSSFLYDCLVSAYFILISYTPTTMCVALMDSNKMYRNVQEHYGAVARSDNPNYGGAIAKAFGYSNEELASIPKNSNFGLSCSNPLAMASLRKVNSTCKREFRITKSFAG
jgi:hypothetical protein